MKHILLIIIIVVAFMIDIRLAAIVALFGISSKKPTVMVRRTSREMQTALQNLFSFMDWSYAEIYNIRRYPRINSRLNYFLANLQQSAEWTTNEMIIELGDWLDIEQKGSAEREILRKLLAHSLFARQIVRLNKKIKSRLYNEQLFSYIIDGELEELMTMSDATANELLNMHPVIKQLVDHFSDSNKDKKYSLALVLYVIYNITQSTYEQTTNGHTYILDRIRAHTEYRLDIWIKGQDFTDTIRREISNDFYEGAFNMRPHEVDHLHNLAAFFQVRRFNLRQMILDNLPKEEVETRDLPKYMSEGYYRNFITPPRQ